MLRRAGSPPGAEYVWKRERAMTSKPWSLSICGRRMPGRGGDRAIPEDEIVFRPMREEDLSQVMIMERDLFSDPWPEEHFRKDIRDSSVAYAIAGEEKGTLVCYGIAWQVRQEFHIANMAVRKDRQRRGIGGILLDNMLEEGRKRGCGIATLEVRFSNREAIDLYKGRGY